MPDLFTIGGIPIGGDAPCRFVAEISNNHNGDFDRALKLIDAAKAAGADFVKFQCYTPDELVALRGDGPAPEPWGAQGWTMRTLYEKAQTPLEWFPVLAKYCGLVKMPWFSSAFGPSSLALLESLRCPAYKIARLDNADAALRALVLATGKPLLVSDDCPLPNAVHETLYCPQGYPQEDFTFAASVVFPDMALGFSFHGTDPLPCLVAIARGAKLIEAHFMLDLEPSDLEANVSLTDLQFRALVHDGRRIEAMLG